MTPARLREIADTLPGYVCGQIKFHADAWERDIADVEHFRTLARGYMDERDEARAELAALRIEHEAHAALLAATRAERDRLRESAAATEPGKDTA